MANINSDWVEQETLDRLDDQKVVGRPLTALDEGDVGKLLGALDDALRRTTDDIGGEGPLTTESLSDVGGPINAALGLAKLNASGKLLDSVIPALAINDIFTPADEAAMLALSTAQQGDIAIRTDNSTAYILSASDPAVLANWKELSAAPVPADFNDGGDTAGANRLLGNTDAYSLALITSGTPRLTVQSGGQVDVAGQIKIAGGTPGLGKVLTSDADGLASWDTLTEKIATSDLTDLSGAVNSAGGTIKLAGPGSGYYDGSVVLNNFYAAPDPRLQVSLNVINQSSDWEGGVRLSRGRWAGSGTTTFGVLANWGLGKFSWGGAANVGGIPLTPNAFIESKAISDFVAGVRTPTRIEFHTTGQNELATSLNATLSYEGFEINRGSLKVPSNPPASATSAGTTGQIAWDSGFIYVCTVGGGEGAATWVRAALSTWV